MKFVHNTRLALGCMLALSIGLNALTPGKRAAIQDLTKQIRAGKLTQPEARKKALALNVPANEMRDFIVQDLIMTADSKGITDIFDQQLATEAEPQIAKTEQPVSTKGKLEDILNQLVNTEKRFIRKLQAGEVINTQQINDARSELIKLRGEFANKTIGHTSNKQEQILYNQHTQLFDEFNSLANSAEDAIRKKAVAAKPVTPKSISAVNEVNIKKLEQIVADEHRFLENLKSYNSKPTLETTIDKLDATFSQTFGNQVPDIMQNTPKDYEYSPKERDLLDQHMKNVIEGRKLLENIREKAQKIATKSVAKEDPKQAKIAEYKKLLETNTTIWGYLKLKTETILQQAPQLDKATLNERYEEIIGWRDAANAGVERMNKLQTEIEGPITEQAQTVLLSTTVPQYLKTMKLKEEVKGLITQLTNVKSKFGGQPVGATQPQKPAAPTTPQVTTQTDQETNNTKIRNDLEMLNSNVEMLKRIVQSDISKEALEIAKQQYQELLQQFKDIPTPKDKALQHQHNGIREKLANIKSTLDASEKQLTTQPQTTTPQAPVSLATIGTSESKLFKIVGEEEKLLAKLEQELNNPTPGFKKEEIDTKWGDLKSQVIQIKVDTAGKTPSEREAKLIADHEQNQNKYSTLILLIDQKTKKPAVQPQTPVSTEIPAKPATGLDAFDHRYVIKPYRRPVLERYMNGLKTKGLRDTPSLFDDTHYAEDTPQQINDLIEGVLKSAKMNYEGANNKQRAIYTTLLPEYYKAKNLMRIFNTKNSAEGFGAANDQVIRAMTAFMKIPVPGTQRLSEIIEQFEAEIDKQPATAPQTAVSSSAATAQPQTSNLNDLINEYVNKKLTEPQFEQFIVSREKYNGLDDAALLKSIEFNLKLQPKDIRETMDHYTSAKEAEKFIQAAQTKKEAVQLFKDFLARPTDDISLRVLKGVLKKTEYPNVVHIVKAKLENKI